MIRIIAFVLLCNMALAQSPAVRQHDAPIDEYRCSTLHFPAITFPTKSEDIALYLKNHIAALNSPRTTLQLLYIKESIAGKHYCFQEKIDGKEVYRAQIKVNVLKNKQNTEVLSTVFSPALCSTENCGDTTTALSFIAAQTNVFAQRISNIYYFHEDRLISAFLIYIENTNHLSNHYILACDGSVVAQRNLQSYLGKKDSTAMINIFNPSPITSAQSLYGIPYIDSDDADNFALNQQIQQKKILLKFENDTFKLENDYYKIADLDAPFHTISFSKIDSFSFNRSQYEFEEVNSFYHVSAYRQHLIDLGFGPLTNFPLDIDAHASTDDQSLFNEFTSPVSLFFGDGGVDDAEDADVIVHEYAHALSASAAPFSKVGSEREAIDEGFGDYVAASYSRSISNYNWENIFDWDGHNEFWSGRTAASTKNYKIDLTGNIHKNGELWSSALMQVQIDIGANITDSLVFQALYAQAPNTSMVQAAQNIIDADSALFNGKHHLAIYKRMSERGFFDDSTKILLTDQDIAVFNTYAFVHNQAITAAFNKATAATFELFDLTGRLIDSRSYTLITQTEYSVEDLSSGVYILKISTPTKQLSLRLLRY